MGDNGRCQHKNGGAGETLEEQRSGTGVQGVRGSLATDERGLIITTSDFSRGARAEAEDPKRSSPISLINGKQLVRLFVENNILVSREHIDLLSLSGADTELGTRKH